MVGIIVAIVSTFTLSVLAVAGILKLSQVKSWYDRIDERKIHAGDVPRLGGIGFALAFIISALVIVILASEHYFGLRFIPVIIAMLLTLLYGIFDDFRPMAPRIKLMFQIIAAACVLIPGYTFHRFFYFDVPFLNSSWILYPVTLLWLVGLPNALNFVDGVDGLAGGLSAIIALTYAAIFASFANTGTTTLLCVCLAAVIGGFLVFNLPLPHAKIFMGDGGSQFLGFMLAILPFIDMGNTRSDLPLPYAAALLLIPILDTVAAVWRRLREGRRIDSPDRAHLHHKLINLGLSAAQLDAVIYSLQIAVGFLVFFAVKAQGALSLVLLGSAYSLVITFFITIHFLNQAFMRRKSIATLA